MSNGTNTQIIQAGFQGDAVGPEGFLINGKIVPSVTNGNLTVAIKTLAGTDPSATDPVYVRIGDTVRIISSALSVVANAGTLYLNLGVASLATKETDLFPYLQWNTTTSAVNFLASRITHAGSMEDFTNNNTGEKGAIGIINYNSTDSVVNIGRFAATLSAGAGYTWSVPTFTSSNLIQRPVYETRWLSIATVFTGFSSVPTNIFSVYKIVGDTCYYRPHANTNGTSNATSMTITAPFKAVDTGSAHWTGSCMAVDSGAFQANPGCLYYSTVNAYIEVYKTWAFGGWTNSGTKNVKDGMIIYKI